MKMDEEVNQSLHKPTYQNSISIPWKPNKRETSMNKRAESVLRETT